jgi:hypothetical protein
MIATGLWPPVLPEGLLSNVEYLSSDTFAFEHDVATASRTCLTKCCFAHVPLIVQGQHQTSSKLPVCSSQISAERVACRTCNTSHCQVIATEYASPSRSMCIQDRRACMHNWNHIRSECRELQATANFATRPNDFKTKNVTHSRLSLLPPSHRPAPESRTNSPDNEFSTTCRRTCKHMPPMRVTKTLCDILGT